MEWLEANWVNLVAIVGGIVTSASLIVKMTPTQKDDAILAKVIAFLKVVALYKKDK